MHSNSTLFTVGTALRRAENNHLPVEVLVHGHWLRGNVAGLDGQGVILSTHSEHAVVRLESISAVRIPETMPDAPVGRDVRRAARARGGGTRRGRRVRDAGGLGALTRARSSLDRLRVERLTAERWRVERPRKPPVRRSR